MEVSFEIVGMKSIKNNSILIEYINRNYGLAISNSLKPVAASKLEKFEKRYEISEWRTLLENKNSEDYADIFSELIEIFLVGHTKFFRNKSHFNFLKTVALPNILYKQSTSNELDLRIWSAGCSSGEEAFSILIVLLEYFGNKYSDITCGVLATDVSRRALVKANAGIYNLANIPQSTQSRLQSYINMKNNKSFQFKDNFRREITVRDFNLTSRVYPFKKKFHVIFCCNVLLYFNRESRIRTLKQLVSVLEMGGFIFTGDAETLNFEDFGLTKVSNGVFQKPEMIQ